MKCDGFAMLNEPMSRERSAFIYVILTAFLTLTLFVAKQATRPVDLAVTHALQRFASTSLDYGLSFFTLIGSIEFTCFAVLTISWYLYRRYEWSGAFLYLFFFVALSVVEFIWKYFVTYTPPGPEFDRSVIHTGLIRIGTPYSFPSGHTFRSVFLLGLWYQRLAQTASVRSSNILAQKIFILLMVFGIGYSRIYLGDHWLSDVIGGYLLAALGVALCSEPLERELRPA